MAVEDSNTKICTKCSVAKPVTEFSNRPGRLCGLHSHCKDCKRIASAVWRAKNPAKAKAGTTAYRAANPSKVKARYAAHYAANSNKKKANTAKWQEANPEKVRASRAKWKVANPEARRIHLHNYRARKREVGGKLSIGLAEKLFDLQRGKCACCKQPLGTKYHRDHRMPLALGGSNTDENIQLLCAKCNLKKGAKHPVEFMQQKGFLI